MPPHWAPIPNQLQPDSMYTSTELLKERAADSCGEFNPVRIQNKWIPISTILTSVYNNMDSCLGRTTCTT